MWKLLVLVSCVTLVSSGSYRINPFVIGGGHAPSDQKLPVASVQYGGKHICGGSILKPLSVTDRSFILTAAQCVYGFEDNPEKLSVLVGSQKLSEAETVNVLKIRAHPDFDPFDLLNDIAVIEVAKLNDAKVVTIEIGDIKASASYSLAGWGRTTLDGPTPDLLKIIIQQPLKNEECAKEKPAGIITDKQFCAINIDAEPKGACFGDAGSPLMQKEQIGIVSWGHGCAQRKPDVYTKVFPYLDDFIKPILNGQVESTS